MGRNNSRKEGQSLLGGIFCATQSSKPWMITARFLALASQIDPHWSDGALVSVHKGLGSGMLVRYHIVHRSHLVTY